MSEHEQTHDEGTAAWHRQIHHTDHDHLSEDTAQTPGMRRYEAISGKLTGSRKLWMGRAHVAPGMNSGDHHHGEAERRRDLARSSSSSSVGSAPISAGSRTPLRANRIGLTRMLPKSR